MDIYPSINATGIWNLLEPFENLLTPGVQYTCKGVRTLADVVADGGDPYSDYYDKEHGISFERYQDDLKKDVAIVSLQADDGVMKYVPNTYIASYPATGGVPYRRTTIALKLGVIPASLDISVLLNTVISAALDDIGIEADASIVVTSVKTLMQQSMHEAKEAGRKNRITRSSTDLAKYLAEKARADSQAQRILELEAALKARM